MGKLKLWTPEEDDILITTSTQTLSKKWKKASEQLKKQGYERSDIECRERFVNHLDPTVSKGSWSDEELELLYSKYGQYGHKWFLLQRHLPGRTQTKIKNYFYGNIRYLLKIIIKTVTNSKGGFINDIKTDLLIDIYEGKNDFEGVNLLENTIRELNYKVDKKKAEELIRQNSQTFERFAKDYLLSHREVRGNVKIQERDSVSLSEIENEVIRDQGWQKVQSLNPVKIVCSVGGVFNDSQSEKEYLQKMMKMHSDWAIFYQKSYEIMAGKSVSCRSDENAKTE